MAGRRYSRIVQSARYYSAIDNYLKYIQDSTKKGQNVGKGKKRPPSKKLFVEPFSINLVENQFASVSGSEDAWNAYGAQFAGYTKAVLSANTQEACDIEGFRPARVIIKTGITDTKTVKTSAVTGMKYLSYGGVSTSLPFGRKATEQESDAFAALAAAIPKPNPTATRITWSKERV